MREARQLRRAFKTTTNGAFLLLTGMTNGGVNRPLTVLFAPAHTLIDEDQYGSEYYWTYKLIQRLALDHGVRIIALTIQSKVKERLPGVRFVSVEPDGHVPITGMDSLRFHVHCYREARRILASGERVDVIHHMLPFGFRATFNLLALLRRPTDPPLVVGPLQPAYAHSGGEEWHVAVHTKTPAPTPVAAPPPVPRHRKRMPPPSTFITTPILSTLSAQTLRQASALVAVSERAARLYSPFTGLTRFTIIPPGVDTDEFRPRLQGQDAGIEGERRRIEIVACGRLIQRKAFDALIRAIGELANAHEPVHLRIIGDGPARPSLESLARELGIASLVTFVGSVPHNSIAREYRKADIFCSTSLGEGFATVSLEALASGLPIVATPTGGFRELLNNHHVGRLVPFGAVDNLASALAELVSNRELRETFGRQARQIAVQDYDWHVVAQRYVSLYERVARQGKREALS